MIDTTEWRRVPDKAWDLMRRIYPHNLKIGSLLEIEKLVENTAETCAVRSHRSDFMVVLEDNYWFLMLCSCIEQHYPNPYPYLPLGVDNFVTRDIIVVAKSGFNTKWGGNPVVKSGLFVEIYYIGRKNPTQSFDVRLAFFPKDLEVWLYNQEPAILEREAYEESEFRKQLALVREQDRLAAQKIEHDRAVRAKEAAIREQTERDNYNKRMKRCAEMQIRRAAAKEKLEKILDFSRWDCLLPADVSRDQKRREIGRFVVKMHDVAGLTFEQCGDRIGVGKGRAFTIYREAKRLEGRPLPVERFLSQEEARGDLFRLLPYVTIKVNWSQVEYV